MSDTRDRYSVGLSVDPQEERAPPREEGPRIFQILVVADLSGSDLGAVGSREGVQDRRPFAVTSIDDAMAKIRPTVEVGSPGGETNSVEFEALEDFHPDRLVARVPYLRALLESVDETVEELRSRARSDTPDRSVETAEESPPKEATPPTEPPPVGLLDDIVEAAPERSAEADGGLMEDLKPWIRDMVSPHLEGPEPDDADVLRGVAAQVRDFLHHPAVAGLEGVWRSLFHLLTHVDPVPEARLYALDLSRTELASMLGEGEPGDTLLFRTLTEPLPGPGGETPVAVLVAGYDFGADPAEVLVLNRLAVMANVAGAPVLAGAKPGLLGLASFADVPDPDQSVEEPIAWAAFRETPAAQSVGLLAPRVMLRDPYGADTDPCERLPFEEVLAGEGHYLFGNAAFHAAAGMVETFARQEWSLDPSAVIEAAGLPIHVDASGEVRSHPVEALWPVDMVDRVRDAGVSPVVGFRGETRVRIPSIRSASTASSSLVGWWLG